MGHRNGHALAAALAYASGGLPIFLVRSDKTPYTDHGFKDATTDEATIRAWFERWPDAGIATPTGPDWFALDIDDEQALEALEAEHGQLPPTVQAATPRPGRHIYLRGEATNGRGSLPDGIDVRGQGGYVLLPPSPHANGVYEWRTAPDEMPIAPAPGWLLRLLTDAEGRRSAPPVGDEIPEGQRNTTLTSLAGTMRKRGMGEAEILAALLVTNRDRCKPPLDESEVQKIVASIGRYPPADDDRKRSAEPLAHLNDLLGLVDKDRVVEVKLYGANTRGAAYLRQLSGEAIVLDPIGQYAVPARLAAEVALHTGIAPKIKNGADALKVLALIRRLSGLIASIETRDRAEELAAEYLRAAAVGEVDMSDQASRWKAFSALDSASQQHVVLLDSKTGLRYVRTGWFARFVREQEGPGASDPVLRAMLAAGWTRPGSRGQIKATRPILGGRLVFKFLIVPQGWGE